MRTHRCRVLKVFVLAVALFAWAVQAAPKYVFLFIGDGMSTPQRQMAEKFAVKTGYGKLAMNAMPHQAHTATKSANKLVTDSAAAATAIACGVKTGNGMLGMTIGRTNLQSIAEFAKAQGRKVGIITSVTIQHATPAGFYAHRASRGMSYEIGLDLVESGFDLFAGGGFLGSSNVEKSPFYRGDIYELARAAGYVVVFSRKDWEALKPGGKSMYMYGSGLPFAIDASEREEHPRLAEVLEKSITMLDGPGGFFIMCEGGKIDYAGHGNDAATSIRETIDLDRAVKVALAFRERNPGETLIIVTGDHETGGLSLGFAGTGGHFDVGLLGLQKTSVENFSSKIKRRIRKSKGEISFNEVKPDLEREFGFCFPGDAPKKNQRRVMLTENDLKVLEAAFAKDVENVRMRLQDTTAHDVTRRYVFAQTVKNVLNAHAGVAWSTFSHTAQPTLTTAIGAGAEIVDGMTENVDISNRLRELLSK